MLASRINWRQHHTRSLHSAVPQDGITDGNIQTFLDLEILIGQSWVHCNKIENSGSKAATEVPPFAWTERPQQ